MPTKRLTKAACERLRAPAAGQVDYFDQAHPGLALRLSYSGARTWTMVYRLNGKQGRITLGKYPAMNLKAARDRWREVRSKIDAGQDPVRREEPDAFEAVYEKWLERDQGGNRARYEVERAMKKDVLARWRGRLISEITDKDVISLIDDVADRAPVHARRLLAYTHRLFQWCVGRRIITVNPAANVEKPGRETKRDRVLEETEVAAVWKAAEALGAPFGSAIRLLILSGARRGEIAGLRWSEVNFEQARITLPGGRTKNGEPHTIPLSELAVQILRDTPRIDGVDLVFGATGKTPLSGWSRAKERLDELIETKEPGQKPWRLHDLRRTVATGLQKLGVALPVTEAVLNHVSGSRAGIVGVYQRHDYDKEKRTALNAWSAHVISLVQGQDGGKVVALRRA